MKNVCFAIGGVLGLLATLFCSVAKPYVPEYTGWLSLASAAVAIFSAFCFIARSQLARGNGETVTKKEKTWGEYRTDTASRKNLIR